jgi:hypothetical protein
MTNAAQNRLRHPTELGATRVPQRLEWDRAKIEDWVSRGTVTLPVVRPKGYDCV